MQKGLPPKDDKFIFIIFFTLHMIYNRITMFERKEKVCFSYTWMKRSLVLPQHSHSKLTFTRHSLMVFFIRPACIISFFLGKITDNSCSLLKTFMAYMLWKVWSVDDFVIMRDSVITERDIWRIMGNGLKPESRFFLLGEGEIARTSQKI